MMKRWLSLGVLLAFVLYVALGHTPQVSAAAAAVDAVELKRSSCLKPLQARCLKGGCTGKDVYAFGVFAGKSIQLISKSFPVHGGFSRLWGFDSFQGIPDDGSNTNSDCEGGKCNYKRPVREDEAGRVGDYKHVAKEFYFPGSWNVSDELGTTEFLEIVSKLDSNIDDKRVNWVRGFYNESLTSQTARLLPLRPALFVDLDCDLYSSTLQALDWMLSHELIVPGTVIFYDDWTHGGPEGQQKAHKEMMKKYGLTFNYRVGAKTQSPGRKPFRSETQPGDDLRCLLVTSVGGRSRGRSLLGHEH
eukprot:gene16105-22247_t